MVIDFFLLIKVSVILYTILFIKSIGDTLGYIKKVPLILLHQYQYCDINNPTKQLYNNYITIGHYSNNYRTVKPL